MYLRRESLNCAVSSTQSSMDSSSDSENEAKQKRNKYDSSTTDTTSESENEVKQKRFTTNLISKKNKYESSTTDTSSDSENEVKRKRNKFESSTDTTSDSENEAKHKNITTDFISKRNKYQSSTDTSSDPENEVKQRRRKNSKQNVRKASSKSSDGNKIIKQSLISKQLCQYSSTEYGTPINRTLNVKCSNSANSMSSLKRSHSFCEKDFPVFNKFTSSDSSTFTPLRAKRRLPINGRSAEHIQSDTVTPKRSTLTDNINRRKSFPFENSLQTSSNRSLHQSCAADQTPFSPVGSYHRQKRLRTAIPYYNHSDLITFQSDVGFIDTHCHLDFLFQRQGFIGSYMEYQKRHNDTFPNCYKGCLAIFCNPYTFNKTYLWQKFLEEENVWGSFGCHPHNAKDYNDYVERSLQAALKHPKVRALGEIGLDYSNRNNCLRNQQHEAFRRQLKIAVERKLPLVIHCREAHEDGMAIMKEIVPKDYFIHLHCFTDTWEWACKWLQEYPNLFIGLTNVVTFPSATQVHEVAKKIPLERLLLETDAPYFVPKPLAREHPETRYSHPGMAIHVAAQVAALKDGISLEKVLHYTRNNTKKMYKI